MSKFLESMWDSSGHSLGGVTPDAMRRPSIDQIRESANAEILELTRRVDELNEELTDARLEMNTLIFKLSGLLEPYRPR